MSESTHFTHRSAAERYAAGRPYFHPLVVARFRRITGINRPVDRIVDVGCGTGQSTRALAEAARQVIGTDISAAMLAFAPKLPNVEYHVAPAESLPVEDRSADAVTVGLAYHWFDARRFLAEVRRILRPGGWLAIYNSGFAGAMKENPAFAEWFRGVYLARFPSPPRGAWHPSTELAGEFGLAHVATESFGHEHAMSPRQLADYLSTQSNIIAAVEEGDATLKDIDEWLLSQLGPLFPEPTGTFLFRCAMCCFRA